MAEKGIIKDLSSFRNYWKELTGVKYFHIEDMEVIQKDTKAAILGILRMGIIDGSSSLRHVMNAQEIYQQIKSKFNRRDSKPTVYFHLNTLVEHGFVEIVGVMETNQGRGRKYTSYYGRTAKMFLIKYQNNERNPNLEILKRKSFFNFLSELNPQTSSKEIKEVLHIITYHPEDQIDFITWQERNLELIEKHKLSLFELYELIEKLYFVQHSLFQAVGSLKQLLQYG